jgi:hypothetical protein
MDVDYKQSCHVYLLEGAIGGGRSDIMFCPSLFNQF